MEGLKIFGNDLFGDILVIVKNNKEYFDGSNVARALGYTNPRDALIRHCNKEGVILHEIAIVSKNRDGESYKTQMLKKKFIDEGNLYRLIIKSKLKEAKKFERWVCDEVIPSIRKSGAYINDDFVNKLLDDPDLLISLATKLKDEKSKVNDLNKLILDNKEYTMLGKAIESTKGAVTIGQYAKIINNIQPMGRNRLYKWFRDNGYFISKGSDKNMPKQVYVESGLFEVCEKIVSTKNGEILSIKPFLTCKGQKYFIGKILENKYLN